MSISLGVFSWVGEISRRNFLQFLGRVCVWLLTLWEVKGGRKLKIWTSVCLHCVWVFMSGQLCLTLYNPLDWSPPGLSVHGIFQARILELVAISFCRRFSRPRNWTRFCCVLHWQGDSSPMCHDWVPFSIPYLVFYNRKTFGYLSRKQNSCLLSGWERGTGLCVSLVTLLTKLCFYLHLYLNFPIYSKQPIPETLWVLQC